jgi:hypothetical protein
MCPHRALVVPVILPLFVLVARLAASDENAPETPVARPAPAPAGAPLVPPTRFRLFEELRPAVDRNPAVAMSADPVGRRLFHQSGDPDSLFTFGGATPQGELSLKAAFEVNDVVLRAIAPDLRIEANDTRPRAAGDYRALDATGRPYQLRLGARLVW